MSDSISVTVGLSAKVSNPQNKFENSTFTRSVTRTYTVAPPPNEADKIEAYEGWIKLLINNLEQDLKKEVDTQIQTEIDQFFDDNRNENEEEEAY